MHACPLDMTMTNNMGAGGPWGGTLQRTGLLAEGPGHDEVQGRIDRSCKTGGGSRLIRELSSSLQVWHQRLSRLQVLQLGGTKTPTPPLSKRINPQSCIDMKCLAYGVPGLEKKDRWRR